MHHLALFNTEQTHLWLAFWCDFFGAVLVVATCLFSVAFSETLGAPNVGLAISNSIQVCGRPLGQCITSCCTHCHTAAGNPCRFYVVLVSRIITHLVLCSRLCDTPAAKLPPCAQVLVFFTWVVRGVADTVSMWDTVERVASFATQVRQQLVWRNCLC
jgi:hypothetical protein